VTSTELWVEYQCARAFGNWGPFDLRTNSGTKDAPSTGNSVSNNPKDDSKAEENLAN
jgi:hypothetical protein